MSVQASLAFRIAEAYRWHNRLGGRVTVTPHCHIVADPDKPELWESNHVDAVTARRREDVDAVFAAMASLLAHSRWRVAHVDGFTSDYFLAQLAFEDFQQRFVTVRMALERSAPLSRPPLDARWIDSDDGWRRLAKLVRLNHEEGRATGGFVLPPQFTADLVASYRAKSLESRFRLIYAEGEAIAYCASAAAPNGVGVVEDVFTRIEHRRRGVASGMIAACVEDLRARGCDTIAIGALADEQPKRLYQRLGFQPLTLAGTWVKEAVISAR